MDRHFSQVIEQFSLRGGVVIGHWSLVTGHWSLVTGHWSLVIGFWFLVFGFGHWSSVRRRVLETFAAATS
jgi:hypothetical protein